MTLAQALRLAASTSTGEVGVTLDSYHLWWDPELETGFALQATGCWNCNWRTGSRPFRIL